MEKWIFLNNRRTIYTVTEDGKIYSYRGKKRDIKKERKVRQDKDGYYTLGLYANGKYNECRVHRLVALAFIDVPDELKDYSLNDLQVNHKDGNKENNSVSNLEWATCKQNIEHAWNTGLSTAKQGENHPNSVYTNNQIHTVCRLLEEGKLSYREISEKTNVTYTVIRQIKNNIIWKAISSQYNIPHIKQNNKK